MKHLFHILTLLLAGGLCAAAQPAGIELSGQIEVVFSTFPAKQPPILLMVEKTTIETRPDSLGNFKLKGISPGTYMLRAYLWNGTVIRDTVLHVSQNTYIKWSIPFDCPVNHHKASYDIHNGIPNLLLVSGNAPVVYLEQKDFEKKYSVRYYDYGSIAPDLTCIADYNCQVFVYLDAIYGKKWRREVRKDVVGLKKSTKCFR